MILHTIGDPAGIGPEVTAKWLQWPLPACPVSIYGDIATLFNTAKALGLSLPSDSEHLRYHATGSLTEGDLPGKIAYDAISGAVKYIADFPESRPVLVTGPINKQRLWNAGITAHGHTEILQDLAHVYWAGQTHQADMLFLYEQFRLILLTRHIALRDVGKTLTVAGVVQSLSTLIRFLKQQGIEQPTLAVMGVNPHAGEIGQEYPDNEELFCLQPAIDAVNAHYGLTIAPPVAADALFRGFDAKCPSYDAYVASYHDQGLIPMKLVAGLQAVNVTLGLPFLRTSVSHGTADDIVGKNIADCSSLCRAVEAALNLNNA